MGEWGGANIWQSSLFPQAQEACVSFYYLTFLYLLFVFISVKKKHNQGNLDTLLKFVILFLLRYAMFMMMFIITKS